MKKQAIVGIAAAFAVLGTSIYSYAATWSDFFTIKTIWQDNASGGYVVQPLDGSVANNGTNDPANCVPPGSNITRYYIIASLGATDRDTLNKFLLASFLAGRGIQLQVSGTSGNCINGAPVFYGAAMDNAH